MQVVIRATRETRRTSAVPNSWSFRRRQKHGPRVKQAEAEQVVAAMQEKGVDYEYLLFEDEGHGFARPENRLKFYAAAERLLAGHLGGRYEDDRAPG